MSKRFPRITTSLTVFGCLALVAISFYLVYFMQHVYVKRSAGEQLVQVSEKYERLTGNGQKFLVVGDSLAYGVGASAPDKSFAGKLGTHFGDAVIVNEAVIGHDVADLAENMDNLAAQHYDAVFIIIGGNDVIRYRTDLDASRAQLETVYNVSSDNAEHVYVITTGDFKDVSIVPWGLRWHFSNRSRELQSHARELAMPIHNVTYIDTSGLDSENYRLLEAKDGFHLNDKGVEALADLTIEHAQDHLASSDN